VSRPDNDPVARMIAQAVQQHVLTGLDLPLPEGVTAEAHATGALDTGIAVTTAGHGVRYFLVSVREFRHR
jgi:hypothetical protein